MSDLDVKETGGFQVVPDNSDGGVGLPELSFEVVPEEVKVDPAIAENERMNAVNQQLATITAAMSQQNGNQALAESMAELTRLQTQQLQLQQQTQMEANKPQTLEDLAASFGDEQFQKPGETAAKLARHALKTDVAPAMQALYEQNQQMQMQLNRMQVQSDPIAKICLDKWGAEVDQVALSWKGQPDAYQKACQLVAGRHFAEVQQAMIPPVSQATPTPPPAAQARSSSPANLGAGGSPGVGGAVAKPKITQSEYNKIVAEAEVQAALKGMDLDDMVEVMVNRYLGQKK